MSYSSIIHINCSAYGVVLFVQRHKYRIPAALPWLRTTTKDQAYIFVCFICCGCKIHLRPLADVASVLDHPYAMIAIPSIKNAPTTTVETRNTTRTTNIGEYSETCSFASKLIRNNICYRLRHRIILPLWVQYNWKENVHRINIAQWTLFILHSIIMLCADPDTIIKWQRAELSQFVRCDIQRRHTPNRENSNGR